MKRQHYMDYFKYYLLRVSLSGIVLNILIYICPTLAIFLTAVAVILLVLWAIYEYAQ